MKLPMDSRWRAGGRMILMLLSGALAIAGAPALAQAQVCQAPASGNDFQKVPLITGLEQPMAFQEDPVDGKIYIIERTGAVKVFDPADTSITTIHTFAVDTTREFGLLGLALDPAFNSNRRLWVYYTLPNGGPIYTSQLSRLTLQSSPLDLVNEKVLFSIPHVEAFHVAGDLKFGPDGNLYLTTGANDFGPGDVDMSAGTCVGAGDATECARYSSSLGTDLRGKLIRVTPTNVAPWYSLPSGNMTGAGMDGRFLSMGHRNPFRIAMDSVLPFGATIPTVYVAEVGTRYEEINRVTSTGYYGWPIFEGPCGNYFPPVAGLPADTDPWLWYHHDADLLNCNPPQSSSPAGIPNLFDAANPPGKSAMAGFVYHFHGGVSNPNKLPVGYDTDLFWWDFSKGLAYNVTMNAAGTISSVQRFAPEIDFHGSNLIDMDVGRNDAVYILEQQEGQLARIDYAPPGTNAAPVVFASATPPAGIAPLVVAFDACPGSDCTFDPNGDLLTYEWDFEGAGFVTTGVTASHTYSAAGAYNAVLRVTDSHVPPATSQLGVRVVVGNEPPVVSIATPVDGGIFGWGDTLTLTASVTDPEDGATPATISCADVGLELFLGHDTHKHNEQTSYACSDTWVLDGPAGKEHALYYHVVRASYEDQPVDPDLAVKKSLERTLWPRRLEAERAEFATDMNVAASLDPSAGGGEVVTDIENDDVLILRGRNLSGITGVRYRVASGTAGGIIEMRRNGTGGLLVASTAVPNTGGYGTFARVESAFSPPAGKQNYYFVFKNAVSGQSDLFDLDWIEFLGPGATSDTTLPTITVASTDRDPNRVTVLFSEPLDTTTAESLAGYSIGGVGVTGARLQPDGASVVLTRSAALTLGASYTVTVSGVKDVSGNTIAPGATAQVAYRGFEITGGAQGVWRFDEAFGNASDSSGNLLTGTMNGVTRDEGVDGSAAVLDGGSDNIDFPDQSFAGDFTVAGWVYLTGIINQQDALVGQVAGGQDINFYDGRMRFYTGAGDAVAATTAMVPDTWTHCAITRTGTTLHLYLNGREDATGDFAGAFTPKVLGHGNGGSMEGMLDEVRLHNRALGAAEIFHLANPTDTGMAGRWQLDDGAGTTAKDVSDFARHATVSGGPTWENGIVGGGLELDGANDVIDNPDVALAGDFTVAGWVKLDNLIDGADALVGSNGAGSDINFFGSLLRFYSSSVGDVVVASTPVRPNEWTHVAVTRTAGTVRLYMDGLLDATSASTYNITFTVRSIGRGNAGYLGGTLDDVRLYRYALAPFEVDQLATARIPGLVGHWTLDDASGTSARDASYNGRTATVSGGGGIWTAPSGTNRGSLALNGTTTFLNPANFTLGTGDFTIAGWVRLTGTADNQDAIVGQLGVGPDINFWQQKARLFTNDAAGDVAIATATVPLSTWAHYAFTRKNGRVNIYRNGVKDAGGAATGCWFGSMPVAVLGRGSAGFLAGGMDDIRVYDVALHPSEIATFANDDHSGLLGHWTFNDLSGADASGAGGTATLNGPVAGTGTVGASLSFDGVNDWVNIPDLALNTGEFTITFWVNLNTGITNADAVVGQEGVGADLNFFNGFLRLWTGSSDAVIASTAATAGSWTRYSVRHYGSQLEIWRNGVLDGIGSWAGSFTVKAIGRGNAGFFGGKIDDVRIYDHSLPTSEL